MYGAVGIEQVKRLTRTNALRGLAMEIVRPGMVLSSRGSGLDACKIQGLLDPNKRTTRKAGLRTAVKNMKILYPDFEIPGTVQKALDTK